MLAKPNLQPTTFADEAGSLDEKDLKFEPDLVPATSSDMGSIFERGEARTLAHDCSELCEHFQAAKM